MRILICMCVLLISACSPKAEEAMPAKAAAEAATAEAAKPMLTDSTRLAAVLAAQDADTQARFVYRHPQQTLEFFGIKPGMTVVEGLPGGGWYSKILVDYLGADGHLIGANYTLAMYKLFGFFSEERLAELATWTTDWPAKASEWRGDSSASISAFTFGSMPAEVAGTADAALMIRAMHNLNRFESNGAYRTAALKELFAALKPGGILGIVQHQAPADAADAWADGSAGYLKRDQLVEAVQNVGFELVGESDINNNPNDNPTAEDIVWRLPPTLNGSADKPELKAKMLAIGESNRMTLKFRKPE